MERLSCSSGKLQENISESTSGKPFHATGLFLYPQKKSEKLWFSDIFRKYRRRPVVGNGLGCYTALNKKKTVQRGGNSFL